MSSYHGDGACDDENNNEACFFDGGDCCGVYVLTDWCTECHCLEEGGGGDNGGITTTSGTTISASCNQGWIADGYCDDINNNVDCIFDGGDCCGSNVNTLYCTECLCLEGEEGGNGGTTTSSTIAVSCGNHFAYDCADCPQGNGADWCNGDCNWINNQCVLV